MSEWLASTKVVAFYVFCFAALLTWVTVPDLLRCDTRAQC